MIFECSASRQDVAEDRKVCCPGRMRVMAAFLECHYRDSKCCKYHLKANIQIPGEVKTRTKKFSKFMFIAEIYLMKYISAMKKMLLLVLFTPLFVSAQLPTKDGKVFYEKIDSCSLTKDQLYNKTKLWLANTFTDSKSVIEVDDKENGVIVGKGNFEFYYKYMTKVYSTCFYTIKINFKDSTYRIQLYNVSAAAGLDAVPVDVEDLNKHPDKTLSKKMLPEIDTHIHALFKNYSESLQVNDAF
jgi:hypothetical protein